MLCISHLKITGKRAMLNDPQTLKLSHCHQNVKESMEIIQENKLRKPCMNNKPGLARQNRPWLNGPARQE